jgi:hypothetical protein
MRKENKREIHHLWGKSERAIFAIITSLLLPIFDPNYQSANGIEAAYLTTSSSSSSNIKHRFLIADLWSSRTSLACRKPSFGQVPGRDIAQGRLTFATSKEWTRRFSLE